MNETRKIGTGKHAVLCLNGWFGHAGDWGPWEDYLNQEDFTWYFHEYRGYGNRKNEPGDFTLDEVTADIVDLIDNVSDADSISLLGHSMGGVFAQSALLQRGNKISKYVGISPVPSSGTPLPPDQRELFASTESSIASRRAIIDITTGDRLPNTWLDIMSHETTKNSQDRAVGGYFKAWADCNFIKELGNLEVPALVIVGSQDPAITTNVVEATYGETFNNLEILEYPDAGHYAMFETPLRLSADIESFLR